MLRPALSHGDNQRGACGFEAAHSAYTACPIRRESRDRGTQERGRANLGGNSSPPTGHRWMHRLAVRSVVSVNSGPSGHGRASPCRCSHTKVTLSTPIHGIPTANAITTTVCEGRRDIRPRGRAKVYYSSVDVLREVSSPRRDSEEPATGMRVLGSMRQQGRHWIVGRHPFCSA